VTAWIAKVRKFLRRISRRQPLSEWFSVTFDDQVVRINARPPRKPAWSQQFTWESVQRVCFNAQDFMYSDEIYVFTTQRPESYLIPTEAKGGSELWSEIIRRGLFEPELAIKAASSVEGLFCCPPMEKPPQSQ